MKSRLQEMEKEAAKLKEMQVRLGRILVVLSRTCGRQSCVEEWRKHGRTV
jgi:hypothetical protein